MTSSPSSTSINELLLSLGTIPMGGCSVLGRIFTLSEAIGLDLVLGVGVGVDLGLGRGGFCCPTFDCRGLRTPEVAWTSRGRGLTIVVHFRLSELSLRRRMAFTPPLLDPPPSLPGPTPVASCSTREFKLEYTDVSPNSENANGPASTLYLRYACIIL